MPINGYAVSEAKLLSGIHMHYIYSMGDCKELVYVFPLQTVQHMNNTAYILHTIHSIQRSVLRYTERCIYNLGVGMSKIIRGCSEAKEAELYEVHI